MRILFLAPYPLRQAPSQRFRFEQYFSILSNENITYRLEPFWDADTWAILYQPGRTLDKVAGFVGGVFRRLLLLLTLRQYDFVFVHREVSPLGPPVFEWLIAKVFRRKIIYDFDDAIWLPNTSRANNWVRGLKGHSKTARICRWAYRVSCGNAYLASYARQFNTAVCINPTTLDTDGLHTSVNTVLDNPRPVIGWTGTHSTLPYLAELLPVLQQLETHIDFEFCVIVDRDPGLPLRNFRFVPWSKTNEIADLRRFDVGVMPLTDDAWARGKCGFKALQYMALGIPPVVSPVGVNLEIVEDGVNGYVCQTPEAWERALRRLIETPDLRTSLGVQARQTVVDRYSVQSNRGNFLRLFS